MTLLQSVVALSALAVVTWVVVLSLRGFQLALRNRYHAQRIREGTRALTLRVTHRVDLSDDLFSVRLEDTRRRALPRALPGQYLTLQVDGTDAATPQRRAYSLARWSARPRAYCLVIRREAHGRVSTRLHATLTVGAHITALPPRGTFVPFAARRAPFVLIGAGVGITPLRAMIDAVVPGGQPTALIHLARTAAELEGRSDLQALAARSNNFVYTDKITRDDSTWAGARGRLALADIVSVLDALGVHAATAGTVSAYVCGPEPMMHEAVELLVRCGVPRSACHTESFGATGAGGATADVCIAGRATVRYHGEPTLLHALESAAVPVERDCGGGSCGSCAVRLCAGTVEQLRSTEFRCRDGTILACCVRPTGTISIALLDSVGGGHTATGRVDVLPAVASPVTRASGDAEPSPKTQSDAARLARKRHPGGNGRDPGKSPWRDDLHVRKA